MQGEGSRAALGAGNAAPALLDSSFPSSLHKPGVHMLGMHLCSSNPRWLWAGLSRWCNAWHPNGELSQEATGKATWDPRSRWKCSLRLCSGWWCLWQMLQPFPVFQTETKCCVFSHIFRLFGNIVKTKTHSEISLVCKVFFFPFLPVTPTTLPWQILVITESQNHRTSKDGKVY